MKTLNNTGDEQMKIIFDTARLIVRAYTSLDQEDFFRLNSNPDVVRYIRPVKSRQECEEFLKEVMSAALLTPCYGRWAVIEKNSGDFIGSFALIPVENTEHYQLGYALLPQHWGKGYATELTVSALDYIFRKTELPFVYGYTELPNSGSRQVLVKAGFRFNGQKAERDKILAEYIMDKEWYLQAIQVRGNLKKNGVLSH